MTVVSFELRDKTQLPLWAESVVEAERPAQLAHAQMPLQSSGVLWKSEALSPLLPQRNRFAQTVNELESGGGASVSANVSPLQAPTRGGDVRRRYLYVLLGGQQVEV